MQLAFPDAEVVDYAHLIPTLRLPDVDDRHVLAAAIAGGATQIVTSNVRHFPSDVLAPWSLAAVSPDAFLLSVLGRHPDLTVKTIRERALELDRPAIGVSGVLAALAKSGAPEFARALASQLLD
jgi:hypothetical protein